MCAREYMWMWRGGGQGGVRGGVRSYLAFELDFLFILESDVSNRAVPIRRNENSRCTERTISPDGSCPWSKSASNSRRRSNHTQGVDELPVLDQDE